MERYFNQLLQAVGSEGMSVTDFESCSDAEVRSKILPRTDPARKWCI